MESYSCQVPFHGCEPDMGRKQAQQLTFQETPRAQGRTDQVSRDEAAKLEAAAASKRGLERPYGEGDIAQSPEQGLSRLRDTVNRYAILPN